MDKNIIIAGAIVLTVLLLSLSFFAFLSIQQTDQNNQLKTQNTALQYNVEYLNGTEFLVLENGLLSENGSYLQSQIGNLQSQLQTANGEIANQSNTITGFYQSQENELNNLQAALDAKALGSATSTPTPSPTPYPTATPTPQTLVITVLGLENHPSNSTTTLVYLQNNNPETLYNCYILIDITSEGYASSGVLLIDGTYLPVGTYAFSLSDIGAYQTQTDILPINYLTLCTAQYQTEAFGSPSP
ncbi:MAG: hypothetical protein ABR909_07010 [Candidatus Bathyarchaeia archaeon]|jgi:hypothetical protein